MEGVARYYPCAIGIEMEILSQEYYLADIEGKMR